MTRRTAAFLLLSVGTLPAWGQGQAGSNDDLAHGRIRYVEPGIAVQRPDEAGSEEAMANTPFLPGDRVWSDASGRAELQFPDGSAVRLDRRSKLDYLEHEGSRTDELVVLNLWSGSVYLRVRDDRRHADFVIETPDGRVEVRTPGNYRVDVDNDTRLRVYDGEARLESGRRSVRVESDETSTARRGEAPAPSADFDAEDVQDDFARWDERRGAVSWQADSLRYLPEEVQPYAADFDTYGQWHYEVEVGYVWRPRVGAGWRPYSDGRWVWTSYGWTWVPFESWGWAPSHYGRWGQSASLGWYWIPGRQWGPAWVSWRAGGDYVGWCALGRGDRPVNEFGGRGYAVARGSEGRAGSQHGGGWFYARRTDMGTRDIARRRVELDAVTAAQAAPIDTARMRLNRESRAVEHDDRAVPRNTRTRATPGDFVPELRYDPLTTIAPAVPRRQPNGQERRDIRSGSDGTRAPAVNDTAAEQRQPSRHDAGEADGRRSTGSSARPGRSTAGERDAESATERKRRAPADDPEVLRHFFTPLVEPRGETARTHRERGSQDDGEKRAPQGNSDSERRARPGNSDGERRPRQDNSDAERRAPQQHATPRREPDRQPAAQSEAPRRDDNGATSRQPRKDHDRRH